MTVCNIWKITTILYIAAHTTQAASLRCYHNSVTNYVEVSFKQSPALVNTSFIKLDQELVIVIHGYGTNADVVLIVNLIENLIKAFGNTKSYCALNWQKEASANIGPITRPIKKLLGIEILGIDYFKVSILAAGVGNDLGKALLEMKSRNMQMNDIYLIGHSEGAHLAGAAGRVVRSSGDLIGRITGLDPAKPPIEKPLDKSCAKLVDNVHTSPRQYGTKKAIGHIDFWINYGCSVQPGCKKWTFPFTLNNLCSHLRAPLLMAEAVKYPSSLQGRRANSYDDFMKTHGSLDGEDINVIGFNTIPNNTGSFFLCTNAEPVYGKGPKGMIPENCACQSK